MSDMNQRAREQWDQEQEYREFSRTFLPEVGDRVEGVVESIEHDIGPYSTTVVSIRADKVCLEGEEVTSIPEDERCGAKGADEVEIPGALLGLWLSGFVFKQQWEKSGADVGWQVYIERFPAQKSKKSGNMYHVVKVYAEDPDQEELAVVNDRQPMSQAQALKEGGLPF